jgi:hypothetical protein
MTLEDAIAAMRSRNDLEWESGDEWSDGEIERFERDTGLKIPPQLKKLLQEYGIIGAEEHCCFRVTFPSGNTSSTDIQVIGASSSDELKKDSQNFLEHRYGSDTEKILPARVPPGYIFFGTAEGGRSHLLMKGDGSGDEAVYHWGLAYDPWMEGDNRTGIGYVAPSLADFLINLKPMAELD